MNISYKGTCVLVKDIKVSREFYEGCLGLKATLETEPYVAFEGGLAIWEVGHACSMIFDRPRKVHGPLAQENFEVFFESDDIEAAWAQVSDAGVDVIQPLREQPWAQRVFHVYDPDGHVVEVAEPMDQVIRRLLDGGARVEAVAEKTMMPAAYIQQVAESQAGQE